MRFDIPVYLQLVVGKVLSLVQRLAFFYHQNVIPEVGINRALALAVHDKLEQIAQCHANPLKSQQIRLPPELVGGYGFNQLDLFLHLRNIDALRQADADGSQFFLSSAELRQPFYLRQHQAIHQIIEYFRIQVLFLHKNQRRKVLVQIVLVAVRQKGEGLLFFIFFHMRSLQLYRCQLCVQGLDLPKRLADQIPAPVLVRVGMKGALLQKGHQPDFLAKDSFRKAFSVSPVNPLGILTEEFKISQIVKNVKTRLILTGPEQIFAKPGAPADHLPKLRPGTHLLEEHQIHNFRHINARIQHIHGNSNLRVFFRCLKRRNPFLGIGHLIINHLGKMPVIVRIQFVEAILNKDRMLVVGGKNDGFS